MTPVERHTLVLLYAAYYATPCDSPLDDLLGDTVGDACNAVGIGGGGAAAAEARCAIYADAEALLKEIPTKSANGSVPEEGERSSSGPAAAAPGGGPGGEGPQREEGPEPATGGRGRHLSKGGVA